jgi:PE-PPE domain
MRKAVAGTVFAVPLLVVGSLYSTSESLCSTSNTKVYRSDVVLTSGDDNDALVLIPAENPEYADVANALYLAPNGFDGTATVFLTPAASNEVAGVAPGVQALVQAIEADYTAGDLSAADPLYVFGYSEGAVEEGLAEPQLAAFGIPTDDLHFVMVGDSASAEGGFSQFVHRLSSRIRATVHHRAFRTAGRNFSGAGRHDPR